MLAIFPIAWLWFRLIDHLRIEWSLNAQYVYGWAVPFLCLYLAWQRWKFGPDPPRRSLGRDGALRRPNQPLPARETCPVLLSTSAIVFAFLYLPTRLVQEANPEWRLVSWALAVEVIVVTLAFVRGIAAHGKDFLFPIGFFLVAVPWPTMLEGPLIQFLARANAASAVELLNLANVPAIQQGNVIEITNGVVGIDEACSGIRSFQATLMLSLFFGEVYRLTTLGRVLLLLTGFGLSFLFNIARTSVLTCVAAAHGMSAIATWHDPAGVTILLLCFVALWFAAKRAGRDRALCGPNQNRMVGDVLMPAIPSARPCDPQHLQPPSRPGSAGTRLCEPQHIPCPAEASAQAGLPNHLSSPFTLSRFNGLTFQALPTCLTLWLLCAELTTETWYRSHELHLPPPVNWTIKLLLSNPTCRELNFSAKTREYLRYDHAQNATWEESTNHWQVIFLQWKPGRTAAHLAKAHTPASCLTAAGRRIIWESEVRLVPVKGLLMPFRHYVVDDATEPLHVFYCLWEDRDPNRTFSAELLSYHNRLAPVLAGRRNRGQRSLEVAIWGLAGSSDAEAALQKQLERLLEL